MIHISFSGTQKGMTNRQKDAMSKLVNNFNLFVLHHGDCIGADAEAHEIALSSETFGGVILHPPINAAKRAYCKDGIIASRRLKPYIERNHDNVDEGMFLVATPSSLVEELRSGTWATIRYARKAGKPIVILDP